jgi:hypothetical protein
MTADGLCRLLLREMTPVIKKQSGDSFVDLVSTVAIR